MRSASSSVMQFMPCSCCGGANRTCRLVGTHRRGMGGRPVWLATPERDRGDAGCPSWRQRAGLFVSDVSTGSAIADGVVPDRVVLGEQQVLGAVSGYDCDS
jgi:hypothetical protein